MKAIRCVTLIFICLVAAAAQGSSQLFGYVKNSDSTPARRVIVSVGNFNVATDGNGYYKLPYVKAGTNVVSLTPSEKATRSFRVVVGSGPTQQDFTIDW